MCRDKQSATQSRGNVWILSVREEMKCVLEIVPTEETNFFFVKNIFVIVYYSIYIKSILVICLYYLSLFVLFQELGLFIFD